MGKDSWVGTCEARYRKTRSLNQKAKVAIILVSILTALLLAGSFLYRLVIKKRKDLRSHNPPIIDMSNSTYFKGSQSVKDSDDETRRNRAVPLFDLSTVASATNNFSVLSKLGQGGFGSVYKAWELWKEGNCEDVIDESMGDSCSREEALRCIQIGLLCVQEFAEDRPNMSAVVFMLANKDLALASPKRPAYVFKSKYHGASLPASDGTASANDVTISMVEGR
ncbi:hypothetical protein NL676_013050 [Syzygium grande]|nr:hypothetical protein NL676_013050 [Syzygium grande]